MFLFLMFNKVALFFQEAVESYDVVLADGSLVHVTRDNEYSDLFQCLPWSHGTLGFLVAVELNIVPVKPYIHMKYISVNANNLENSLKLIEHIYYELLFNIGQGSESVL